MRLTLRTMLAYLDDTLEPADAQDIGRKIEESEYAQQLVARIRNSGRRLRLTAPSVLGRGPEDDPNVVAEYLDNTLSPETVSDFEKLCLESDVHLAEVAACHQILTLVLGEPANVTAETRQRMYRVLQQHDAQLEAAAAARQTVKELAGGEPEKPRRKVEVPDYLREDSNRRVYRYAVAVMLLVALGLVVLVTLRPDGGWLAVSQGPGEAPAEGPLPSDQPESPLPDETQPTDTQQPATEPMPAPVEPEEVPRPMPPDEPADEPVPAEPAEPARPAPPPAEPAPSADAPKPPVDEDDVVEAPVALGQLVSEREVLLFADEETGQWQRRDTGAVVLSGDRLLALPMYRPMLTLASGMTLTLHGPTRANVLPTDMKEIPGVRLDYGRLVAMVPGRPAPRLHLANAARRGTLNLGEKQAVVAVEVYAQRPPGTDPEQVPSVAVLELFVDQGVVMWEEAGAEPQILESGSRLRLVGDQPGVLEANVARPAWLESGSDDPLLKRAAEEVQRELRDDAELLLSLRELADHRKQETAALAVHCLNHLGWFDGQIRALADPEQRSFWNEHVEALRTAVARSPQAAAAVRESFEKVRLDKGAPLYRMLWGYTAEQLNDADDPEALRLVNYLNYEEVDFRVLAFWNLRHITGLSLGYQPHYEAALREQPVNRWRKRLEAGQIVPGAAAQTP